METFDYLKKLYTKEYLNMILDMINEKITQDFKVFQEISILVELDSKIKLIQQNTLCSEMQKFTDEISVIFNLDKKRGIIDASHSGKNFKVYLDQKDNYIDVVIFFYKKVQNIDVKILITLNHRRNNGLDGSLQDLIKENIDDCLHQKFFNFGQIADAIEILEKINLSQGWWYEHYSHFGKWVLGIFTCWTWWYNGNGKFFNYL